MSDAHRPDWQRPPFEPGNALAELHGAYSPRRVDPIATGLIEEALRAAPYLGQPSFAAAVLAWARTEARVQLLSEWLDSHGPLSPAGRPRPALDALARFERLALDMRQRLGIDPLSRSKLARDITGGPAPIDLAKLWAAEPPASSESER